VPSRVQSAIQVSDYYHNGTVNEVVLASPATAGNLILLSVANSDADNLDPPSGFSQVHRFNAGGAPAQANIGVFAKIADGGEQSLMWAGTGGSRPVTIAVELTDVNWAARRFSRVDGWAATESPWIETSVAAPQDDTMAVSFIASAIDAGSGSGISAGTGFTKVRGEKATNSPQQNWPYGGYMESTALYADKATITARWNDNENQRKSMVLLALPPASPSSAPTLSAAAATDLYADGTSITPTVVLDF